MSRLALAAALAALPLAATPESPPAEGRIETAGARVEILGRAYRAGETIQLPEGYLRIEEAGPEDEEVGSFTVVPAAQLTPAASAAAAAGSTPAEAQPAAAPVVQAPAAEPAPRRCRAERAAYLAEILKQSGIEVSDPAAFLDGLEASGSSLAEAWFAFNTDSLRTLAWSSDARGKAAALARCMRSN